MRYLHKIFHEKENTDFNDIYQKRIDYESVINTDLSIKPSNQPNEYTLYYVPTNKMIGLVSQLHKFSREIHHVFSGLPNTAQEQFIIECLVEEIYNTNELEGVRSSKEEITRSTKEIKMAKNTERRLDSMIKSYIRLSEKNIYLPGSPEEIREVYEDITEGEIKKKETPDGEIFRKDPTFLFKKSGSGKVIHTGMTPESKIIEEVQKLIDFMDHNNIPHIIKAAIGHYFFGYIHPFYDGNGRTSRFITSMYLADILGEVAALSLSRGCNKEKNKYLESFEVTNSLKNRGEMNSFIETFLSIILSALKEMYGELKEKNELLKLALEKIKHEKKLENEPAILKEIMFVIAQNHFFNTGSGITVQELSKFFSKSEATIRKVTKALISLSLIDQNGKRPAYFSAKNEYFES